MAPASMPWRSGWTRSFASSLLRSCEHATSVCLRRFSLCNPCESVQFWRSEVCVCKSARGKRAAMPQAMNVAAGKQRGFWGHALPLVRARSRRSPSGPGRGGFRAPHARPSLQPADAHGHRPQRRRRARSLRADDTALPQARIRHQLDRRRRRTGGREGRGRRPAPFLPPYSFQARNRGCSRQGRSAHSACRAHVGPSCNVAARHGRDASQGPRGVRNRLAGREERAGDRRPLHARRLHRLHHRLLPVARG